MILARGNKKIVSDILKCNYQTFLYQMKSISITGLLSKDNSKIDINQPPTNVHPTPPPDGLCCGSGCQKCVWYVYAEELLDYHKDGGKKALEALKDVPDPNIREFLKMELQIRIKS